MKKRILTAISSILIMTLSGVSQAVELELYPQHNKGGSLSDGVRIAKGLIICRDVHSSFHLWMNTQKAGGQSGHYTIKGQTNSQHEIRVRLSGDGWSPSTGEDQNGMVKIGNDERAIFDVLLDGNQYVAPGEYIFTVRGLCL
ncbi:TPA: adhesin [Escherichia coli]|nr:adhesin [Escherichia coli]HAX9800042.1 adhesin [Escherichia coli]HAY0055819.1 adhesin [Escherichia coli]